jgi:2-iminobutanoate/2-iminopropanoate deaminase
MHKKAAPGCTCASRIQPLSGIGANRSVPKNRSTGALMNRPLSPQGIRRPFARYSHGLEVAAGARLVFCSGQLGVGEDDIVPAGVEAQAELCFGNIGAILGEAGLGFSDIVRINAYVTAREHMAGYMAVRDRHVGDPPPASTLMIVSGFTRPEFLVEVEAIAAAVP